MIMVSSPATVPSTSGTPARSSAGRDDVGRSGWSAHHDDVAAVRHLDHELPHDPSEMVVGATRPVLAHLGHRVRHRPSGDADLHCAEILEITTHRRLGREDALRREELHQLALARHRLLLEESADAMLTLRLAERGHPMLPSSRAISARAECIRLAPCSHTTDAGPSITSAVTSSPRCAGRQCRNLACDPAAAISARLT